MRDGPRYWDEVAREWGEKPNQALWRAHSDAVNRELLARWLPPGRLGRVLKTDLFDEACGEGLYGLLASRARLVVGLDLSTLTAHSARTRFPDLAAVGADARALPFGDDSFDAVVSNSTLDHFETRDDILAGLRELRRVLRRRGVLILTLDNLANPVVALRQALPFRWLKRLGLVPYQVGATCGPRGLRHLLEQAGLEVEQTRAVLHCPRTAAVLAASWLDARASSRLKGRYLKLLAAFEALSRWPTRFATGYFVAVRASKP